MRLNLLSYFFISLILFSACSNEVSEKKVDMYNSSGDMVGTATLSEQSDGVNIKLKLEGLSPGFHGIHVHEYPKCDGPDFISAGNHLNPEGKEHGLMHPEGAHLGDLPNIKADSDGLVTDELILSEATLSEGKKSLLQGDGTSLIITSEKDDGVSQPGGDSGSRIICGKIMSKKTAEEKGRAPTDPTQYNDKQKKE